MYSVELPLPWMGCYNLGQTVETIGQISTNLGTLVQFFSPPPQIQSCQCCREHVKVW